MSTHLNTKKTTDHVQLVLRQHGHRHRVHPVTQSALQRSLAVLDISRDFLPECCSFRCFLPRINSAIHTLSRYLDRNDPPSSAVALSGHVPDGPCNYSEYGCFRVCPSLGSTRGNAGNEATLIVLWASADRLGVGFVVDRRRNIGGDMFLPPLRHVRSIYCDLLYLFVLTLRSMYFHHVSLETMTAAWLLPIVSTIVAAASGGIVAEVLPNHQHALWTITISYILWGTGVPLAMMVLVIYFQRLTVYHLPPREVIVSVFLPLGPLGQGGFAVMRLGRVAATTFVKTGTLNQYSNGAGDILYVVGWLMALIMWGFGLVWLFFAMSSISRSKFPFNMGWWGFTFPLGVFTVSTTTIGSEMPSTFFRVLGTVCGPVSVLRERSQCHPEQYADASVDSFRSCNATLDRSSYRDS